MTDKFIRLVLSVILLGGMGLLIFSKLNPRHPISLGNRPWVKVQERQLLEDFDNDGHYKPYFIKGVAYSPMPVGRHPSDWGWKKSGAVDNIFDDEAILYRDFALLKDMHCNTIRIWKGNDTYSSGRFPVRLTQKTLDLAESYGLKVIAGFWMDTSVPTTKNFIREFHAPDFADPKVRKNYINRFVAYVNTFKDHHAVLFWAIGNENNLHLDSNDSEKVSAFYSLINDMAQAAHNAEGPSFHPVAFVNGEITNIGLPSQKTTDSDLTALDIWGANVYRGKNFGDLFSDFSQRSEKPLWISEFGMDAFEADHYLYPERGREDQETQAQWLGALWDEISSHRDVTIGGTVMEYSDEWWKPNEWIDEGIHNSAHDFYGDPPSDLNGDGYVEWYPPAPDNFFHQEWFGIMAVEPSDFGADRMVPRKAYYVLQGKYKDKEIEPKK